MKYEKLNLINADGLYLAYTLSAFTARRSDAFWSTRGGIEALFRDQPHLMTLKPISTEEIPVVKTKRASARS